MKSWDCAKYFEPNERVFCVPKRHGTFCHAQQTKFLSYDVWLFSIHYYQDKVIADAVLVIA
jgi:hypothetical protein